MVKTCAVPGCKVRGGQKGVHFFNVPSDPKRLKLWDIKLRRNPKYYSQLHSKMKVCSQHFLESEYSSMICRRNNKIIVVKKLKPAAYPTIFPWSKKVKSRRKIIYVNKPGYEIEILPVDNFDNNENIEIFDGEVSPSIIDTKEEILGEIISDPPEFSTFVTKSKNEPEYLKHCAERNTLISSTKSVDKGKEIPSDCCSVPMCNPTKESRNTWYFNLPKEGTLVTAELANGTSETVDLAVLWCSVTGIRRPGRVCSAHFLPKDFVPGLKGVLKLNAVPSQQLPFRGLVDITPSSQAPRPLSPENSPVPSPCATPDIDSDDESPMSATEDITNLCRICAESGSTLVGIFSTLGKQEQLAPKMCRFLNITVSEDDLDMPLQVCQACVLKLDSCQKFADLAVKSDENFKQLISKHKGGVKNEPGVHHSYQHSESMNNENGPSTDMAWDNDSNFNQDENMPTQVMKTHLNFHLSCEHCSEVFTDENILHKHLKIYHGYCSCVKCKLFFRDHISFKTHIYEKHSILCKFCNSNVLETELKSHMKYLHAEVLPNVISTSNYHNGKSQCKICDAVLVRFKSLKLHYFYKHQTYSCEICEQLFPNSQEQILHTQEVHMIPCLYCEKIFYTPQEYRRHKNKEHKIQSTKNIQMCPKNPDEIYECNFCLKGLSNKLNVKRHNFWSHSKYTCAICLETFTSSEREEEHYESHGDMCIVCEIRYDCEDDLAEHVATCHPGFKAHSCEHCGDSFNSRSELKDHSDVHKVVKSNLCYICGKSFSTSAFLTKHIKSHDVIEERNQECHICYKRFTCKSALNRHAVFHTAEKPFQCSDCNKSYVHHKTLEKHMLSHLNNTKNFNLTTKKDLKSHKANSHL